VDDINEFRVVRARDGSERARIAEKRMCCVASFTAERLVIRRDDHTRVLYLDASGAIRDDRVVEASLAFSRRVGMAGSKARDVVTRLRRADGVVTLSEIDFDSTSAAVPEVRR
jgi:hypothetical protein